MSEEPSLIEINPQKDVSSANKASGQLKILMDAKPKKVIINGKRHLEIDDWQTIAAFFGATVATENTVPVVVGGVDGFRASAHVINKSGLTVGNAEAYCMLDEDNWKDKPTFQLASMAQTRAASKALSNVYRWVVVMGGFAGTPAEEMTGNERPFKPIEKKCTKCGVEITDKVYKFSVDTYHTPLCFNHQKELKEKIDTATSEGSEVY